MNGTATPQAPVSPAAQSEASNGNHAAFWPEIMATLPARGNRARASAGRARQAFYLMIDFALVALGGVAAFWLRFGIGKPFGPEISLPGHFSHHLLAQMYPGFLLLYAALIALACMSQDLYRTAREQSAVQESCLVCKAVLLATGLLVLFIFTSGTTEISRVVVAGSALVNAGSLAGWRYAKRRRVLRRVARGEGTSRVLIVGAGKSGQALAYWLEKNSHLGYAVCGFLDAHPNGHARVLGSISDLRRVALAEFVDHVFVTLPADREVVKEIFLEARSLRLNLNVVPDLYDGIGWSAPVQSLGGFPVIELHGQPIPVFGLAIKRAMDVLGASAGLLLAAPVLALAALWIRIDSPGRAVYSAMRVGKKGKRFRCYKLRTMVLEAEAQKETLRGANERTGPWFKMENDPRVTRCGRWMRKFSVDELPQLLNVLVGHMSLVGPRPHPLDDVERYTVEHLRRLDVKPGVTGLWQVKARRDPSFDANMALDLDYIETWSLRLDLQILWQTAAVVLEGKGQ